MLHSEEDTRDAIQEVMIKLWRKRDQLQDHPNRTGYVFLTARNHCRDVLRRKRLQVVEDPHESDYGASPGHEDYALRELVGVIENLLREHPERDREILLMRDLDGMEYREIASVTGLKVEHIRVIISRTRSFVQQHLKKNYNYE